MKVRDYALRIIESDRLADKLAPPPVDVQLEDDGPALRIPAPGRPPELAIVPCRHARVPPLAGMSDPAQRARILHALANHELQAIELFAWALLAFPDAPLPFRRGLVATLADEQRHFRMYDGRLAAHDTHMGDHKTTGYFWNKKDHLADPLHFVCVMGMTFEAANLDFSTEYALAAYACGDIETARVLDRVHNDEIRHVRFAWKWLRKFSPYADPWTTYVGSLRAPLRPAKACGAHFNAVARRAAGLDGDFIAHLIRERDEEE